MVLLTMTPSIVDGLKKLDRPASDDRNITTKSEDGKLSLDNPAVGHPISHDQILNLWRELPNKGCSDFSLERLLRGTRVYVPPPPTRPEPTDDFKALMARLRHDEEARSYERMTRRQPQAETLSQNLPNANMAAAFAAVNRPMRESDKGDDDVTYKDVNRQVMLIINFMVSIVGVAATIWIAARWWSTPARLFLTMAGSIVVAIAEVAVYWGYIWRLGEAKEKQEKAKEVKEVVKTWVLGPEDDRTSEDKAEAIPVPEKQSDDLLLRRRKKVAP